MSVPKGYVPPRREVPCTGCGKPLLRCSHFDTAVCHPCDRKRHNAAKSPREARRREEARRYRILMAVGPYSSYEEMLAAVRIRGLRGVG